MSYPFPGEAYDQIALRSDDLPWWAELVREAGGRVLELGVGTGRLALPLSPLAAEYHGVDGEPSMLAELRRKARAEARVVVAHEGSFLDLLRLELGGPFDLVFIPANTISHVVTHVDAERFFAGVRRVCRPGGRFVLDTFNPRPQPARGERYLFARYRDPDTGREVEVHSTPSYDHATQVVTHALEYTCEGRLLRAQELRQRVYYPAELASWLLWAGFREVAAYGDYHRGALRADSARLILAAT